ncbi:MAG TPA: hypothetical protein VJJ52_07375 [Candidatus Nanoarchaeia archaeon]|nr:hypothetical protein [Candidatus Nanoarchaeia archaeon]
MSDEAHKGSQQSVNPEAIKSVLEKKLESIEYVQVYGPNTFDGKYFFEIYFGGRFIGSAIPQRRFAVFSTYNLPERLISLIRYQLGDYEIVTQAESLTLPADAA